MTLYFEERKALVDFCDQQEACDGCVLDGDLCRCGRGTHFLSPPDGWRPKEEANEDEEFGMTDEEIAVAYYNVFGVYPLDPAYMEQIPELSGLLE